MTPGYFSFINTAQICLWIKIRWATRSWSARSTECWWREPYLLSIILNNSWLSEWQKQILLRDHHSPAPLQCSRRGYRMFPRLYVWIHLPRRFIQFQGCRHTSHMARTYRRALSFPGFEKLEAGEWKIVSLSLLREISHFQERDFHVCDAIGISLNDGRRTLD